MSRPQVLGADRCAGGAEYGHGMTLTTVHAGGCCADWEAAHPVHGPGREPAPQPEPEAEAG
jgi:hypothetical protein